VPPNIDTLSAFSAVAVVRVVAQSFAPSGLLVAFLRTHGLRRGLYSCAAPRRNALD